MNYTEVNREKHVILECAGGAVEWDVSVSHVERVGNEGWEVDVVVSPDIKSIQWRPSLIPYESKPFCEEKTPDNAPNTHPLEDGNSVLGNWVSCKWLGS